MTKASDNPYPSLLLEELDAAPASPAADFRRLYFLEDGVLWQKDSAGAATRVGPETFDEATHDAHDHTGVPGVGGGGGGSDPKSSIYPVFTPAGIEDEFDNASFTGWTTVDGAGYTEVVTEANDLCSVYVNGGGAIGQILAFMKATTVSVGDYIETAFRMLGPGQNYLLAGLVMADGVTVGAGTQVTWGVATDGGSGQDFGHKRLTGYQSQAGATNVTGPGYPMLADVFLRLEYQAANTWRFWASPDGVSWIPFASSVAYTMTPTHVGFWVSTFGGASPLVASFRYFKYNA